MCATITCSWEEEDAPRGSGCGAGAPGNQRSSGPGLASVLAVFDTLADACFASFGDGDADTLAASLAAVWAADGTLRRVASSSSNIRAAGPAAGEAEEGDGALPPSYAGSADGEATAMPSGHGTNVEWVEDSRMVGIVRSLAERCPGLPVGADTRAEQQQEQEQARSAGDDGDGGGGDGGGEAAGCRGGSSTGGVRESIPSEEPEEQEEPEEAAGGAAWPVGSLSLAELAGAVLDAVGPEATGEVLAACPLVLESLPPKVCARTVLIAARRKVRCYFYL